MTSLASLNAFFRGIAFLAALCSAGIPAALAANTATVTPGTETYAAAGGAITFTVSVGYSTALSGLDVQLTTPSGWRFVSAAGTNVPQTIPSADDLGAFGLGFVYSAFPANQASFTFTLSYPAGMTGTKAITGIQASFTDEATSAISVVSVPNIALSPVSGSLTITTQPANQSVAAGTNAGFSVEATGTPAPTTYVWQRSTDGGTTWSAVPNSVPYSGGATASLTITAATVDLDGIRFRVIVGNGVAPDVTSSFAILSVGKIAQAISFGQIGGKVYGDPPFALAASASSGLPISYSNSDPAVATVNGNIVTIVGAGSTTITATQPGNATFNAASAVAQLLAVAKADQTITFVAPADRTYGVAPFAIGATASSGLPVSLSVAGPATLGGSTITITGAGNVTLTANQAGDASYNPAPPVVRTFAVAKAPLTVTADNKTRIYGAANPGFTVTYAGFVNGETAVVLTTAPAATTTATVASNVGSYPITPAGGVAANYAFTYVNGALAVTKASLTAKADDKSKVQGAANPTFTIGYIGFVNADTATVIDTPPTAATTATTASALGTYPITLSGGSDNNYDLVLQAGIITVVTGEIVPPFATRTLPAFYVGGQDVTVTIQVTPALGVQVYAVEDVYPVGWTYKSSATGGANDTVNKKVKFGPFFDNTARTLTYVITAPLSAVETVAFSGKASADGVDSPIIGTSNLAFAPNHPADNNPANWRITINEVTAYGAGWKRGDTWPIEPNPIPISYVTRAGLLWKGGEVYHFDGSASAAPLWWVSGAVAAPQAAPPPIGDSAPPPSLQAAPAASSSVRAISGGSVTITITPDATVGVYAVEELIPAGLTVSAINNAGSFDTVNRKVKWGPFFDNTTRTLGYTVAGADGNYTLSGVASFDGIDLSSTGPSLITLGPIIENAALVVAVNIPAGGAASGGGTFAVGSSRTIGATPNTGYYFTGWSDGNISATRLVTVSAGGVTYTANFAPVSLVVAPVSVNLPAAGGTVSLDVQMAPAGTPGVTSNAGWLPVPAIAAVTQTQWTIMLPVGANAGPDRSGIVTITAHGLTRTVNVVQAAVFVPLPPANVSASDTLVDKVTVAWTAVAGATAYNVYRAATNNSLAAAKLNVTPLTGVSFDDATASVGVVYFYFVKSLNGAVESGSFSAGDSGQRPSVEPPVIVTPPVSRVVRLGGTTTFTVTATGSVPLSYQWNKGDSPIPSATTASYTIENVQFSQAGTYTVTVSNSQGAPTSVAARLDVVDAQQAIVSGGYAAGGTVTVSLKITFAGPPVSMALDAILPDGWSYGGGIGEPETRPLADSTGVLGWSWTSVPVSPTQFTYDLKVPVNEMGIRSIRGRLIFRQASGASEVLLLPDPLVISNHHSADTRDGAAPPGPPDSKIDLFELTRVIELYNTRNGTVRTGAYKLQDGTEDGFTADAVRLSGQAATLLRYHSADTKGAANGSPRDGAIDLFELTRVIELYNTRAGTVRTGEYHVHPGSEDGFAPGPVSLHPGL